MRAEVLIIGGGIIGLAIAHRLARDGHAPVLVEAERPGGGTTQAAAGMLCPGFELPHIAPDRQEDFHAFAMRSLLAWPGLAAELKAQSGQEIDLRLGSAGGGAIGLAENRDEVGALKALAGTLSGFGRPAQWLDRDALEEAEPGLGASITGGLRLADEGEVDPRLTAAALTQALANLDVPVLSGEAVTRLVEADNAVTAVETQTRRIETGQVILAAGLASRDFWREPSDPPFFSIKGQAMSLSAGDGPMPRHVLRGGGVYVCPKAGGRVVIGASEESHVETLSTDDAVIEQLGKGAGRVFPALAGAVMNECWAGLRPTTADRLPVIGRSRQLSNLIYASGHHRNGILLAPETAALVASLLDGAEEQALVSPERFG